MFTNRAIKLLNLLLPHEQEELLSYLKKSQKQKCYLTAKAILKFLRKKNGHLTKEEIFQEVYNTEYTAEQDYLLRNDFRLLAKDIEEFCSSSDVFKYISETKTINFLALLLRSNDFNFIDKEFNAKEALLKNPTVKEWFKKFQRDYQFYNLNFTEEALADYEAKIDEQYQIILENTAIKLAELNTRKSFINRQRKLMGLGDKKPLKGEFKIDLFSKDQSKAVRYLGLKSESYNKSGLEVISKLKECEQYLNESDNDYFNVEEETIWLHSNLGFHYFLVNDFKNSALHFNKALKHPSIKSYRLKDNIIYNYVSTCLKLRDFKTAEEIIIKYRERLAKNMRLAEKFTFHEILLYIYTKNFDQAKRILHEIDEPKGMYELYYYKTLQVVIYILNDEYSRAQMELKVYRATRFPKGDISKLHKTIGHFFKHYLRLYDRLESLNTWDSRSAEVLENTFKLQSNESGNINFYDTLLIDLLKEKVKELERKRDEI